MIICSICTSLNQDIRLQIKWPEGLLIAKGRFSPSQIFMWVCNTMYGLTWSLYRLFECIYVLTVNVVMTQIPPMLQITATP